jgi:hypothetical protein
MRRMVAGVAELRSRVERRLGAIGQKKKTEPRVKSGLVVSNNDNSATGRLQ